MPFSDREALEREIEETISRSLIRTDLAHARSTRRWVLRLMPDADYALLVAALGHDIERGAAPYDPKEDFGDYEGHKREHCRRSAEALAAILERHGVDSEAVEKARRLVLGHEFGGDPETDVLMDADSLSFFEETLLLYYKKYGEGKAREKIRFMYGRMSENAQRLAREIQYEDPGLARVFKEEAA